MKSIIMSSLWFVLWGVWLLSLPLSLWWKVFQLSRSQITHAACLSVSFFASLIVRFPQILSFHWISHQGSIRHLYSIIVWITQIVAHSNMSQSFSRLFCFIWKWNHTQHSCKLSKKKWTKNRSIFIMLCCYYGFLDMCLVIGTSL